MEDLINYKIGDVVCRPDTPNKPIGICTELKGGCVLINHSNYGGAIYKTKFKGKVDIKIFDKEIAKNLKKNEWNKTHEIHKDKVEISIIALIEIKRAFDCLKENKESYLHKVFGDDYVFGAISELNKTYKDYFEE